MRLHRVHAIIAAAIVILIPAALYGNGDSLAGNPTPEVTPEGTPEVTRLPSGAPCPASPAIEYINIDDTLVSGEDPIWVANNLARPLEWSSDFPKSLPPYPGVLLRALFLIKEEAFGDLELQATQLDGDGIVLFPLSGTQMVVEDGVVIGSEIELDLGEPVETRVVPAENSHAIRNGYRELGALVLFPNPGCYQLTATVGEHTVNIVYDIQE